MSANSLVRKDSNIVTNYLYKINYVIILNIEYIFYNTYCLASFASTMKFERECLFSLLFFFYNYFVLGKYKTIRFERGNKKRFVFF
jgi:hypothetical protein